MSGESVYGYLLRLSSANGFERPRELWKAMSKAGCVDVRIYFKALGTESKELSAPAPGYADLPVQSHGLADSEFNLSHFRWCSLCMAESPYLRAEWGLKAFVACTRHKVMLVERCNDCGELQRWERGALTSCPCGCQLTVGAPTVADPSLLSIMSGIMSAIKGGGQFSVADTPLALSLAQGLRLLEYLGQYADGPMPSRPGQLMGLHGLDVALRVTRGAVQLLHDWPNGFRSRLEAILAEDTSTGLSVRRVFGRLYRVLYTDLRDPEFQFLRDAFETFLHDRWQGVIGRRNRSFRPEFFGRQRRVVLTRFARGAGTGGATIRNLVLRGDLDAARIQLPSGRHAITLDVEQLEKASAIVSDQVDLLEAKRILGLGRRRVLELVDGGMIPVLQRSGQLDAKRWYFQRSVLDTLLARLVTAVVVLPSAGALVTLGYVLKYWQIDAQEFCDLVQAVLDGVLIGFAGEQSALSALQVDESELRAWLVTYRSHAEWLSVDEAARQLGLKQQVAYELVTRGLLASERKPRGGHSMVCVLQQSVVDFKASYISLAQLAKEQGLMPRVLLARLSVSPVTGPSVDGGRQYFFLKADFGKEEPMGESAST